MNRENATEKDKELRKKATILYVEDDETLSYLTRDNLEEAGFEVLHCPDGREALSLYKKNSFDLCILDVMLPKVDGFEVASQIRKSNPHIPIIFLTAKSMQEDKLNGLALGGDDYITKPFDIEELILKVEIFLKRKFIIQASEPFLFIGKYKLDKVNLKLFYNDEWVKNMTEKECDLLELLIKNQNTTLKRAEILHRIWGQDDYFLGRSMDVFISRLRKCLSNDPAILLENVHGVGFRLIVNES